MLHNNRKEKGNYTKFLKNLHSEQLAKLQLKNQHECDLLEDMRSFIVKRSAIEKSYSEALLKISTAYLNKKTPNIPDIKVDGGEERWNVWNVWRTVLEENEKLAKARLAACEVFQQQIADEAKALRNLKLQSAKKHLDQLATVQKELQASVQELDKTKKLYFDEEHSAHDVRDKAKDLEEKLKKKKGSFFQSITSLQKNSAKFSSKRDQLEEKSTGARNEYLLSVCACNAHQTRYYAVDLRQCSNALENNVYRAVCSWLSVLARTELLTAQAAHHSYTRVNEQATHSTAQHNLQCCQLYYPVLKQHIQYEFEPCDSDPVRQITIAAAGNDNESGANALSREARRWAARIQREQHTINTCRAQIQVYQSLRDSGTRTLDPADMELPAPPGGGPAPQPGVPIDVDTRLDELHNTLRRAETSLCKAQARLDCIKSGAGPVVDQWLQDMEGIAPPASAGSGSELLEIPRSSSVTSVRTDVSATVGDHPSSESYYDSDYGEGDSAPTAGATESGTQENPETESSDVDAMLEQERQKIEQLTADWEDPTNVDWGSSEDIVAQAQTSASVLKCTALYTYTAQNPDELSIVENEQLEIVGAGDGDGWIKARNYRGEEGYVPHNYMDIDPARTDYASASATDMANSQSANLVSQISFSSVDYTVEAEDDTQISSEVTNQSPEQISVINAQPDETPNDDQGPPALYCIALYDYEALDTDELTLEEGQIIKILNKSAHNVDDGWWYGELDGKKGNFPSLVVEECDEFGEPISNEYIDTPPMSAPPIFTPPEIPEFLLGEDKNLLDNINEKLEEYGGKFEFSNKFYNNEIELQNKRNLLNGNIIDEAEVKEKEEPDDTEEKCQGGTVQDLKEKEDVGAQETQSEASQPTDIEISVVEENKSADSDIKAKFSIELSRGQVQQYGRQFDASNGIPTVNVESTEEEAADGDDTIRDKDFGLGVAQIVITAATPMMEEAEHEFPACEESEVPEESDTSGPAPAEEEETHEVERAQEEVSAQDQPAPQTQVQPATVQDIYDVISSSSESASGTGPSTADNSLCTQVSCEVVGDVPQVVGGRASIPDELEPHQLARLQDLKESNA